MFDGDNAVFVTAQSSQSVALTLIKDLAVPNGLQQLALQHCLGAVAWQVHHIEAGRSPWQPAGRQCSVGLLA